MILTLRRDESAATGFETETVKDGTENETGVARLTSHAHFVGRSWDAINRRLGNRHLAVTSEKARCCTPEGVRKMKHGQRKLQDEFSLQQLVAECNDASNCKRTGPILSAAEKRDWLLLHTHM
jgi:hypothetical protein